MAIDKRQIADINFTLPNFGLQLIVDDNVTDVSQELSDINGTTVAKFTIPKSIFVGAATDTQSGGGSSSGPAPLDDPQDLAFYDPYTIVQQVRAGRASTYWKVGDRIRVQMDSFALSSNTASKPTYGAGLYELMVIGFDHNLENETPDYEHTMTFMFTGDPACIPDEYTVDDSLEGFVDINNNLYTVFSRFADRIYYSLPDEWSDIIIPTTKTGVFNLAQDNCKIFLLSNYEARGNYYYTLSIDSSEIDDGKQKQYEYFKKNGFPRNTYIDVGQHFSRTGDSINDLPRYCLNAAIASRTLYNGKKNTCLWLNADVGTTLQWIPVGSTKKYSSSSSVYLPLEKTISDPYCVTNNGTSTAGIIPCFTIG